ncbi:unnamed protein product [Protopolystoma xenopodis]|uniref:Uncharacterized protein n=1 Tax=Protopolystoma xenopodis TaxID=117903 RepID=A0A3S5AQG7_9PLAT|nr:unnamed protein product [Protopolystoma xenopodis]
MAVILFWWSRGVVQLTHLVAPARLDMRCLLGVDRIGLVGSSSSGDQKVWASRACVHFCCPALFVIRPSSDANFGGMGFGIRLRRLRFAAAVSSRHATSEIPSTFPIVSAPGRGRHRSRVSHRTDARNRWN